LFRQGLLQSLLQAILPQTQTQPVLLALPPVGMTIHDGVTTVERLDHRKAVVINLHLMEAWCRATEFVVA
jgi:hypothetical protein